MPYQIQTRNDTLSNLTDKNPVLAEGEAVYVYDVNKVKYGNGKDEFTALPWLDADNFVQDLYRLFDRPGGRFNVAAHNDNNGEFTGHIHLSGGGNGSANLECYGADHLTYPKTIKFSTNKLTRLTIEKDGSLNPGLDGVQSLGSSSLSFNDIHILNSPILTSDEREKTEVRPLSKEELALASLLQGRMFKWKKAVKEKGDNARFHAGLSAQEVEKACEVAGINPRQYGFFVLNEWWEYEAELKVKEDDSESEGIDVETEFVTIVANTWDILPSKYKSVAIKKNKLGLRYNEIYALLFSAIKQILEAQQLQNQELGKLVKVLINS